MRTLLALLLTMIPTAALAAATPWQEVAPGARLRLISSDQRGADGRTLVGLELDMPRTYRTYWRLPGESGIPTEIDASGSQGVADPRIDWPYPTREVTGDYLDFVYRGPLVLPVAVKADAAGGLLVAQVVMGVCSEVCVPVRARFSLPLRFGQQDLSQSIRLRQAESQTPVPWDGTSPPFGNIVFDAKAGRLTVQGLDPAVDPASVLVVTADPGTVFDAPQKSPDGRSLVLALRGMPGPLDWLRQPISLTFMTPRGAYEVSEQVTTSGP